MRWLYRIALVFGAFVVALFAAVLIVHNYYQTYLANILIARFKARSGLQLIPERSSFRFSTHLVIRLDRPRVLDRNQQILELNRIELACSYHALLFEGGLPLYSIVLDRPALRLFGRKSGLSVAAIPPLNAQAAKLLQENVQRFSGVTRRVIVNNASIVDSEGHLLFDNIFVDAYRKRKIGSTWRAKFDAIWRGAPLTGVKVAGDLRLGNETSDLTQELGHGTVWFWNVPLQQIQVASLHPAGELQGNLFLTIRGDGSASADSAITIRQLQFSGGRLKAPTAPQNVALHLAAQFSEQRLALSRVTLTGGGHPLMQAEGYVQEPYSPNPTVRVKVGDVQIDTPQFKKFAAQIRDAPSWLTSAANQLKAGRLKIDRVW